MMEDVRLAINATAVIASKTFEGLRHPGSRQTASRASAAMRTADAWLQVLARLLRRTSQLS
jgi:hypothetical protein